MEAQQSTRPERLDGFSLFVGLMNRRDASHCPSCSRPDAELQLQHQDRKANETEARFSPQCALLSTQRLDFPVFSLLTKTF